MRAWLKKTHTHTDTHKVDKGGTQMCGLERPVMILPQVHLRKPCYDFSFL